MKWVLLFPLLTLAVHSYGFNTVVIDAGHGGHDRGGVPGQKIGEKALTLDVSRRVRAILNDNGLKTVMTRSDDTFIPLQTRVDIANSRKNAVFVSIHFNSAPREGASGIETYYYQRSAAALAKRIQTKVVRVSKTPSRWVRRKAYFVLRKTRIPAVLVECGFLTNRSEGNRALNPEYRQQLAEAIASAVIASQ